MWKFFIATVYIHHKKQSVHGHCPKIPCSASKWSLLYTLTLPVCVEIVLWHQFTIKIVTWNFLNGSSLQYCMIIYEFDIIVYNFGGSSLLERWTDYVKECTALWNSILSCGYCSCWNWHTIMVKKGTRAKFSFKILSICDVC